MGLRFVWYELLDPANFIWPPREEKKEKKKKKKSERFMSRLDLRVTRARTRTRAHTHKSSTDIFSSLDPNQSIPEPFTRRSETK